jgi:hypothetical protein
MLFLDFTPGELLRRQRACGWLVDHPGAQRAFAHYPERVTRQHLDDAALWAALRTEFNVALGRAKRPAPVVQAPQNAASYKIGASHKIERPAPRDNSAREAARKAYLRKYMKRRRELGLDKSRPATKNLRSS